MAESLISFSLARARKIDHFNSISSLPVNNSIITIYALKRARDVATKIGDEEITLPTEINPSFASAVSRIDFRKIIYPDFQSTVFH